jgi:phytoene synthase
VPKLSYAAEQVRHHDRDRFVIALLSPEDRREAMFGLYAFNLEVARVRELVSEPMLGRIRLQWWRDSLEAIFAGKPVAHPVAEALAAAVAAHELPRSPFDRLIDGRESDLEDAPPADLPALEDYAEATASTITALGLDVLGVREEAAFRAARHVGIAWALTGLLRAVPFHAAAGRLYLPLDLLEEHGVEPEELLSGTPSPGLAKVARTVADRARDHLARARAFKAELPKQAVPGLLAAPLADAYLNGLDKARFNLLDTHWSMPRPRPVRLAWNAWLGRF